MHYPSLTLQLIDSAKGPLAGIYTITPAVAAAILKDRNPTNRAISRGKAAQATHDVTNGEFVLNGEALIFSDTGLLLDGQHRLTACVAGDKPITSVVSLGYPAEVRNTVDQGKARTVGDVLTINGCGYANELSSMARHLLGYYAGDGSGFGRIGEYSTTEILDWIDAHPTAAPMIEWASSIKHHMIGLATSTQFAITRFILEPKYGQAEVVHFLERVAVGDNIGTSHPAFAVRRRLQQERSALGRNTKRVNNVLAVEILMRGFLSFHLKRPLTKVQLGDGLPTINKTARAAGHGLTLSASSGAVAAALL